MTATPKRQKDAPVDIEAMAVTFMRQELARLGVERSGAYEFYEDRLAKGRLLDDDERGLVEYLNKTPARHVVHVGVGLGVLDLMLHSKVTAYEPNRLRCDAAMRLADTLIAANAVTNEADRIYTYAAYPNERAVGADVLLFTRFVTSWALAQEKTAVATFPEFERVILDPRLFGRVRTGPEQAALRTALEKVGAVRDIGVGRYVEITPSARTRTGGVLPPRR